MKFGRLALLSLLIATNVYAENLDISLFDDDPQPNLGRKSDPLTELRITPPPLPEISVDLGQNETTQEVNNPQQPEQTTPSSVINLHPGNVDKNAVVTAAKKRIPPVHDVRGYEIHGFSLGMTPNEVLQQAKISGYTVKTISQDFPRFYASDYANQCNKKGIIIPKDVRNCISDMAHKDRQIYTSQIDIVRGKTDAFSFFFTSNNADNELYKIIYYNYGDNSLNFTRVNTVKKQQRQKEFWQAVYDYFGKPDDPNKMIWGNPNKAYMKVRMYGTAYNAMIELVDHQLYSADYFAAKDIEQERPPKNDFNFE